jgi:hypothetical protein
MLRMVMTTMLTGEEPLGVFPAAFPSPTHPMKKFLSLFFMFCLPMPLPHEVAKSNKYVVVLGEWIMRKN